MSYNTQSGPEGVTFKKGGKKGAAASNMSGVERNKPRGNTKQGRRILESAGSRGTTKGLGAPLRKTNISKPRT